jgi:hypothetical protein
MIRACGADDVALALPRQKFRKRRFQMIDDKAGKESLSFGGHIPATA